MGALGVDRMKDHPVIEMEGYGGGGCRVQKQGLITGLPLDPMVGLRFLRGSWIIKEYLDLSCYQMNQFFAVLYLECLG